MTQPEYICGYEPGSTSCRTCLIQSACPNVADEGPEDPILNEYRKCGDECQRCRGRRKW
jgi:hypothetical protein